jgi:NAD(P)-dependent dehydrogenase (short-subunit alcohol dehydrogenase family)
MALDTHPEPALSVEGKVVAVTGTTAGIGRTVAEVFAERGALVVGCGRRAEKGSAVADKITAQGGAFTFVTADVTDEADCIRFVDAAVAQHGRIDVLINNAGGSEFVPTGTLATSEWDRVLRLNLYGPFFCSQRAIHHMKAAGGGLLLHIASVQGVLAVAMAAAYNVSKAALIQLSNTYAVEYLDHQVRSNVIVMGGAPTAAAAGAVRDINRLLRGAEPDFGQQLPTPLTGTPLRDIGTALVALSGDDARAITGATIAIDQAQSAGSLYSEAIRHALSGGWNRQ